MKSALYVHIPFCSSKCDYCDFYSLARGSGDQKSVFTRELVRQLNYSCEKLEIDEFSTVYIGGGTPTSLTPESLDTIFSAIHKVSRSKTREWSVEVNPESLRKEHLELFATHNLSRISMGVQSLHEPSREFLGRRGSLKSVWTAFELLREYWRGGISIDLIRGLPEALSLPLEEELSSLPLDGIEHISLYDLSLEEGTPLAMRTGKFVSRRDMLPGSIESIGFQQYEVSNYSRPGKESRHNQSYWDMDPYLGIGPGAVSLLCEEGTWIHQSIRRDLDLYLYGKLEECTETEIPTGTEFFIEHLFMGLRQVRGISLERIEERFGLKLHEIIPHTLSDWDKSLSMDAQRGRLSLISDAFWIQDRFFLDAWRELETHNPFA